MEAALAQHATRRWTLEEFLAWDDGTDRRYELHDGEIVAMAPPAEAHGTIVSNLTIRLGVQLKPPCRIVGEAGVIPPESDSTYFQADFLVTCAAPERGRQTPPEPVLIAEVLSPSTGVFDRARKLDAYCQMPSVNEVLLVWSEERRLQHWKRTGAKWSVENLLGSADLKLDLVPGPIPLEAIYEGTSL